MAKQQEDKSFLPPIRVLLVADDQEFNVFLQNYIKEFVSKNSSQSSSVRGGDFRVYLVPNKVNTLAHYLAMHDDLYCQTVYLAFTQNPIYSMLKRGASIDRQMLQALPNVDEHGRVLNLMDEMVQDYLRDAQRVFPLKVFVAEFYKEVTEDRPYKYVYFTSRFELGHCSVYEKLNATHSLLTASNMEQLKDG